MDDIPTELGGTLFIVSRAGTPRWVVLECPCGCGDRIDVNLSTTRRPYWKLRQDGGSVSLFPSLWRPRGTCGSHFWIRRNRIEWFWDFDDDLGEDSSGSEAKTARPVPNSRGD